MVDWLDANKMIVNPIKFQALVIDKKDKTLQKDKC